MKRNREHDFPYQGNLKSQLRKIKLTVCIMLLAIVSFGNGFSEEADTDQQQKKVTGIVNDQQGQPVPGASVIVKGTTVGGVTDIDGKFSIEIPADAEILQISFIGMKTQEIPVEGKTQFTINLETETIGLDEVVAVGYGTSTVRKITGAIDVIDSEAITERPVTSTTALLQGVSPGLIISNGGTTSNSPGSSPSLTIRAKAGLDDATPPLYVIDGIESSALDFNRLNTEDIESFSVLKDAASAAIYGSGGVHGVILVTTKGGKIKKRDTKFKFTSSLGIVTPINEPTTADSYTFALSRNYSRKNAGQSQLFDEDKLANLQDYIANPEDWPIERRVQPHPNGKLWNQYTASVSNNDWRDLWTKDASYRQNYNLSAGGSSDKMSYYVSVGFLDNPGILNYISEFDNFQKYNLNARISAQLTKTIKLGYQSRYWKSIDLSPVSYTGGSSYGDIFRYGYAAWPTQPETLPETGGNSRGSRVAYHEGAGQAEDIRHQLDNTLTLDYEPIKGLVFHSDASYRLHVRDYEKVYHPIGEDAPDGQQFNLSGGRTTQIWKTAGLNDFWTLKGRVTYDKQINDHSFGLMAGAEVSEANSKSLSGSAKNLIQPDFPAISTTTDEAKTVSDGLSIGRTTGFYGRFNYDYKEKYILTFNGRYNGSQWFAPEKRWSFFPSLSAGWILSEESFWADANLSKTVNFFKLTGSYGGLGNQKSDGEYYYIPTMTVGSQSNWIFNGSRIPYVNVPGNLLNYDRTWETVRTTNFGAEAHLFDSRLQAKYEYWIRDVFDLLGPVDPLPSVLGVSAPKRNNTTIQSKGFELNISWRDRINKHWSYNASFNLSDAQSEV
ncbi:MAG: SusC/RagA family TonB-linked outer membrane protein, partial [Methylococcales bacterium]|nr:SusC/RagA family TonB-linked outer membrane protein [Methylococcales bacterium]